MIADPLPQSRATHASGKNETLLNIGIVTTSFPMQPGSTSGIFVQRLVKHMPANIKATVLTPCGNTTQTISGELGYRLICFRYGPTRWQRLTHGAGGLPESIRRRDPTLLLLPIFVARMFFVCWRLAANVDVIHGNWSAPGFVAALAARMRGRPAITTLRGTDVKGADTSLVLRWLLRACLLLNSYVITVSQELREDLIQHFPRRAERIVFVPNGVEMPAIAAPVRLAQPLQLLTIGNLVPGKRVETILQAVAVLRMQMPITLRIVGDGPERDGLSRVAGALGIHDSIKFVGTIPPERIAGELYRADVFVFASAAEGRPNAVVEAMAAGLPVVATDIPGTRELIASGVGLLFPVDDAIALAQAIGELIAHPARARALGRAARARVQEWQLTWSACAERYAHLYADVAGRTGSDPCAD